MSAAEYSHDLPDATRRSRRIARAAHHIRGCREKGAPRCGGAFRCTRCKRIVGWCQGGDDDWPDWCGACVVRYMRRMPTAEAIARTSVWR